MLSCRICLVFAMLTVACGLLSSMAQAGSPIVVNTEHLICRSDLDCVIVETGHCPCLCRAKGMLALNKVFAGQYKQPENCSTTDLDSCAEMGMCGQVKVAKCEQGRCVARMPY